MSSMALRTSHLILVMMRFIMALVPFVFGQLTYMRQGVMTAIPWLGEVALITPRASFEKEMVDSSRNIL